LSPERRLSITARRVLAVEVRDNGVGIPTEEQERIFTAFQQVDASYSRQQEGTGLGLALTRRIVHLLGGDIWFTSAAKEGSTFWFYVPFEFQENEASREMATTSAAYSPAWGGGPACRPAARRMATEGRRRHQATSISASAIATASMAAVGWAFSPSMSGCRSGPARPRTVSGIVGRAPFEADSPAPGSPRKPRYSGPGLACGLAPMPVARVRRRARGRAAASSAAEPSWQEVPQEGSLRPPRCRRGRSGRRHAMTEARRTILVIEDDPLNRELFEAVLDAAGYVVITTGDARTGIEVAKLRHPDAVLMDIQLPEMDGLEATRILHATSDTAAIPVIAVTAHAKKEDEEHCLAAGCVLHLPKPVDTRALPGIVAGVIDEARAGRSRDSRQASSEGAPPAKLTTTVKSS
jgi:CheY-like chemotaxis protein